MKNSEKSMKIAKMTQNYIKFNDNLAIKVKIGHGDTMSHSI